MVDVETISRLCSSTWRSRFLTFVSRLEIDVLRTLMAIELVVDLASIVWMCKRLLWVVEVGGSDSTVDSFIGKVDD